MKINEILKTVSAIRDPREKRVSIFNFVRDIPYYVGGEQNYQYVLAKGHGDCKGKADLLAVLFNELGYATRPVIVRYKLRNLPAEAQYIPDQIDYHHTLEVFIENHWVLTDATYDSPLGSGGYIINRWDGESNTRFCEKPLRIKRGHKNNASFDDEFRAFSEKLNTACERYAKEIKQYTMKYNTMIKKTRERV